MILIAAGLFCLSAVNFLIDPSAIFCFADIHHLNKEKPKQNTGGGRRNKSAALAFNRYDIIIVGTSRCQVGMDPGAMVLQGKKVYNAGLPGMTLEEINRAIDLILERNSARELIVETSFLGFHRDLSENQERTDFDESLLNPDTCIVPFFAKYLFSVYTLMDSATTVWFNAHGGKSHFTRSGLVLKNSRKVNNKNLFRESLAQDFRRIKRGYADFFDNEAAMRSFGEAISKCKDQGLKVVIFIPPLHAVHLEALRISGLYEQVEKWKTDLLAITNEIDPSRQQIRLFDFADYSKYTTERVPEDAGKKMKWYVESSHFKKELGNIILQRIYEPQRGDEAFGVLLSLDTISQHLSDIRERQSEYIQNHPREIRMVERISKDPETGRKKKLHRKRKAD